MIINNDSQTNQSGAVTTETRQNNNPIVIEVHHVSKNFGDHPQNILVQFVADENLRTEEE